VENTKAVAAKTTTESAAVANRFGFKELNLEIIADPFVECPNLAGTIYAVAEWLNSA
jgi:hypothetical protein